MYLLKILVLYSDEKNLLKSKEEIENRLFKRVKEDENIDIIVSSSFINNDIATNPEILKDIDGILYTSDVQRKDVEKLTPILKETSNDIEFARIRVSLVGETGPIDYAVKDVITLTNFDLYPYIIRYKNMEVEKFFN
ncbi:MAG: hypothetical protein US04_C0001G0403 [Candidatus Nomurabacteria bacterium GW2011_GWD2_36_14]|nr:MAG: hypothetical protein UR97_C0002G0033 [Candidatus Nomurabacteria bacterium GW2011_GWE2_36_115]KKP94438.1 MAG: hypothetical protein US00_C0001G0032 [Candidatus Nomurabacteria bacterium GW2011_GWF2_36_126]KKP96900.1 MAG: hypothetical protein US04_C0001G0403 [Candidatus Nomurabacteria bacterium GW2011_GWD2_36_14]KKP99496.1 MAG: hypothetical protein US08_C0001G0178 [Candidatus Nomurabacteria bacterium GW2011_GWF2_36_19]KKQ05648.1 MAG: hypothetical protein US17_C0002G0032 [Candidatus Nomuraba